MNIFDLLQMFRDNHGGLAGARLGSGSDPLQQLLLAAAQNEHDEDDGFSDEEDSNNMIRADLLQEQMARDRESAQRDILQARIRNG